MPTALLACLARIDGDLTRRRFVVGGCGTRYPARRLLGLDPQPAAAAYRYWLPVRISHKYGSTEILAEPKRIAAVGLTEQDVVLALGLTPVGTREWFGDRPGALWPWAADLTGGVIPEVLGYELSYEKIAALRPDLILAVAWGVTDAEYPKLARIAPTVAQSGDHVDGGTPWQDQTRIIGRAVGREQRAGELVVGVEDRLAGSVRANPQFAGATGVVAYEFDGGFGVYGPEDPRARLLTSLGFVVPSRIVEVVGDEFYAEISAEQLELVDADVVVWILGDEDSRERVRSQPLYRTLAVAREGRDVFVVGFDVPYAAFSWSTVLSLPVCLDGLVPQLAAALDGDPTTSSS